MSIKMFINMFIPVSTSFLFQIQLSNAFKDLYIGNIQATSLTMMHDGEKIETDSTLQLEPMEIYTYKLKLE